MAGPDLDEILRNWPYDDDDNVRLTKAGDDREVLQMRIDLGVMQLETTKRPDGHTPGGFDTYFDYLVAQTLDDGAEYRMTEEQCIETDREFVQFYHRRICWLQLKRYADAVVDADHTLGLMDFCRDHSPDERWTLSHEQYRPFVLYHRTQGAALAALEAEGPEASVEALNEGLLSMQKLFEEFDMEERFDEHELVQQLKQMREEMRSEYDIGRTLKEQLSDAVADEQYELAAELRDRIEKRAARRRRDEGAY